MRPDWLRLRYIAMALLLFLSGCKGGSGQLTPGPVATPAPPVTATLHVASEPEGARVSIDGQPRGISPLSLSLPAGQHTIAVTAEGYESLTESLTLEAGREGIYAPVLVDSEPPAAALEADSLVIGSGRPVNLHASASDGAGLSDLMIMMGGQILGSTSEGELVLPVDLVDLPGVSPGDTVTLTALAVDRNGNEGRANLSLTVALPPTPAPTARPTQLPRTQVPPTLRPPTVLPTVIPTNTRAPSPSPAPTVAAPRPAAVTSLRITEVTIPTYPYAPFVSAAVDPQLANYPLWVLDRAGYEASNPAPAPKTYRLIVLENEYLRLSILPDLGGRIYECVFKPTGNNEFYRNPVIKPTGWGPASPPSPAGANWWLAVGGMEWGFPVEEHGYEWGARWGYDHATLPDGGVMISVFTWGPRRPYATVDITLSPGDAYFTLQPQITNPWGAPFRFKWWSNAMLAPGAANTVGPELRFIFPTSQMTVHSRGDESLPGPGQALDWPVHNGVDLSRLGNWTRYLGFFSRPAVTGSYVGVYDPSVDEGMVRVYPPDVARGAKGFAFGYSDPVDWHQWTDDGSAYVELHGGLMPTFDEWYPLPPGGQVDWSEMWFPVAGIGGVVSAAPGGALNLTPTGSGLRVRFFPTRELRGKVSLAVPGMDLIEQNVTISPARPLDQEFPYAGAVPDQGEFRFSVTDERGELLFGYQGQVRLR